MIMEDLDLNIALGDDYDCETCGYTYNSIRWEEFDDNLFMLNMRVGCYGGVYAMSNDIDFYTQADSIIADCRRYEGFGIDEERLLRNTITKTMKVINNE